MTELPITILLWLVVVAGSIVIGAVVVFGALILFGVTTELCGTIWKRTMKRRTR